MAATPTIQVTIRFTVEEADEIQRKADAAGTTRHDYIRQRALGTEPNSDPKRPSPTRNQ